MASFVRSFTKTLSKPARVSQSVGAYGAPKGLSGITGVKQSKPFENAINDFGTTARKGLKGLTTVRKKW